MVGFQAKNIPKPSTSWNKPASYKASTLFGGLEDSKLNPLAAPSKPKASLGPGESRRNALLDAQVGGGAGGLSSSVARRWLIAKYWMLDVVQAVYHLLEG